MEGKPSLPDPRASDKNARTIAQVENQEVFSLRPEGFQWFPRQPRQQVLKQNRCLPHSVNANPVNRVSLDGNTVTASENVGRVHALQVVVHQKSAIIGCCQP